MVRNSHDWELESQWGVRFPAVAHNFEGGARVMEALSCSPGGRMWVTVVGRSERGG